MASDPFPSTPQTTPRVPRAAWDALRAVVLLSAIGVCISMLVAPRAGLFLLWGLLVPLLPLLFLVAPGVWRNLCPLAASSQLPRRLGLTRGLRLPAALERHGYLVAVALFLAIVPARKVLLNTNGTAIGILLLATIAVAFASGLVFAGKSGWCSTFCPLLPVQRVYGQTPFVVARNSHCEPCVGCTRHCYDFNPHVAQVADLLDDDPIRAGYRRLFAGALPGVVLAFYTLPGGSGWGIAEMYGRFGLFVLGGIGAFVLVESLTRLSVPTLGVLFGAAALNIYYWYNWPLIAERVGDAEPAAFVWPARAAVVALTVVWITRTVRKERRLAERAAAPAPVRVGEGGATALAAAAAAPAAEVRLPDGLRIAAAPGSPLLDVIAGSGLPIEAGCRMGVCGADPVAIIEGADNLSPVGGDERATLERLGLGGSARLACCARVLGPVAVGLDPRAAAADAAPDEGAAGDPEVRHVVVIGNGIAGVTAAEHVRRNHAGCSIDLVAREPHHLYNRMAISRLIYGRSAMGSLFLMPDAWYDQQRITAWLNTRVVAIDREARQVRLGTGEVLPYDRLVLTTGSRSAVPSIEGFGAPGSFVLREAEDALRLRAFVQETHARRAAVAGGGLLGIEAAYAMTKLGLHVTLLETGAHLLRRQLDERAAELLARYLEGLGMEIVTHARAAALEGGERVAGVTLTDGRTFPADLVLVAAGNAPNVELAQEAGLAVERGVVVDDAMRSSDPAILAAGDVAEHGGRVQGLWPTAVEQARVAAVNAVGGDERYVPAPPATILKVAGVDLISIGRIVPSEDDAVIVREDAAENRYGKLILAGDRIVGAILLGHPLEAPAVTEAIREGADAAGWLARLEAGDWSMFAPAAVSA